MAQSDYVISDQDGASFLVDINGHLQAIATINSGATAPTTTYAYQLWADTASGLLKQRNAANDGWINKGNLADVDWGLLNKAGGTMTGLLNLAAGTDIASATTVDLTAATGNCPKITGTTAVTAWTMDTGQQMKCIAGGALPLTYHATTNNIEGGASYTCAAGDIINLVKGLDGVVRVRIEPQSGVPIKGGKVLQVVQGKTSTPVTNSTAGFVATGLSASITPSSTSSKILVLVNQQTYSTRTTNESGYGMRVLRDSTVIQAANSDNTDSYAGIGGASAVIFGGVRAASVLDSPATTSAITYSVTARPNSTGSSGSITHQYNNSVSSIILMEIAA